MSEPVAGQLPGPLPVRQVLVGTAVGLGMAAVGLVLIGGLIGMLWWHAAVTGMAHGPVGCS